MPPRKPYDVFICHASEDKDKVARPLARNLERAGLAVWYDEFSLKLGDSLRRSIERGLSTSRFGVVIFSPSFFTRKWPQDEPDGLFAGETKRRKVILPVWHHIGREFLVKRSPILADRVAALTKDGLDMVTERILSELEPARAHRTKRGHTVAAYPNLVRLGTSKKLGEDKAWSVRTPIIVFNGSDKPAYAVCLKISLSNGIDQSEIKFDGRDGDAWHVTANLGDVLVSSDLVTLQGVTPEGEGVVFAYIHTIQPRSSLEFTLSGPPREGSASIGVVSFQEKPAEMLHRAGDVAWPFRLPEAMVVRQFGYLAKLRR